MATLDNVITQLEAIGVFRYVLPFLITFAIVFGILQKISLFGEEERRIDAIVALVSGFFVANYAYTAGAGVSIFLSNFFGAFAIVLVFILAVLVAAGIAGYEHGEDGGWIDDKIPTIVMYLGGLAILAIFVYWGGLAAILPGSVSFNVGFLNSGNLVTLFVVLGAILLIYYIVRAEE